MTMDILDIHVSAFTRLILTCVYISIVSVSSVMIRQFPLNITTMLGGEATFSCQVVEQGNSEYVFWKKVGHFGFTDVLSYNNVSMDGSKYSVHGTYELTVHHVQLSDEAEYECQAGVDRARASLSVGVLMENMTLSWDSASPIHPKSLVNLTCHVINSRPPAEIRWFHGNSELTTLATSCKKIFNSNGFGDAYSTLKVFVSDDVDELPYTCVASLPGLSISRTEVTYPVVLGALTSSTSTSCMSIIYMTSLMCAVVFGFQLLFTT